MRLLVKEEIVSSNLIRVANLIFYGSDVNCTVLLAYMQMFIHQRRPVDFFVTMVFHSLCRGGRVVECIGLQNRQVKTSRQFESGSRLHFLCRCSSMARASGCHPEGCEFDSHHRLHSFLVS